MKVWHDQGGVRLDLSDRRLGLLDVGPHKFVVGCFGHVTLYLLFMGR